MSLHQWTSSFLYTWQEKLPQEHANLLKYCFTVRKIGSPNDALMMTGLGDTMMKILESSVSQTKSPGNFQSLNTWSRHVLSLIPFVLHKTLPVVQRQHSVSASTTTIVQSANTHLPISNTSVNSAVNSTQGSNVSDQTKARLVLDQQVATTIKFEMLLQELQGYATAATRVPVWL